MRTSRKQYYSSAIIADKWLGSLLNRKVYKVDWAKLHAQGDECVSVLHDYQSASPVFMYAKSSVSECRCIGDLEKNGFCLVDINVQFEKNIQRHKDLPKGIRWASPCDKSHVMDLARRNFHYSRFHLDPHFSKEEANTIKAEWAGNFFSGQRGDSMVIAEDKDRIVGFLQLIHKQDLLVIDLIAVDAENRKRGIASGMTAFAESSIKGFKHLSVGTQAANVPAVRLYEKLGFAYKGAACVFHFHG